MPEACIFTLEKVPEAEAGISDGASTVVSEVGVAGYWAIEFRSWHDRVVMLKKKEELGC